MSAGRAECRANEEEEKMDREEDGRLRFFSELSEHQISADEFFSREQSENLNISERSSSFSEMP